MNGSTLIFLSPAYGSQMTHSLDSFITDSANSASSLFTGKKMSEFYLLTMGKKRR
jgi:alkaline phosphatase